MAERSHGWWTRKDRGEIYTTREDVCPAMREGLCEHPWPSDRCDRSVGRPPELASTRSLSGRAAAMLTAEPPPTPMSLPSKATPWSFARLYRPLHRVSSLVEAATKPRCHLWWDCSTRVPSPGRTILPSIWTLIPFLSPLCCLCRSCKRGEPYPLRVELHSCARNIGSLSWAKIQAQLHARKERDTCRN